MRTAAEAFMAAVLDGEVTPAQLGGLLLAHARPRRARRGADRLRAGDARRAPSRSTRPDGTIDICGTGGDVHSTFNISTAASIVTAAAGVPVAKAGNRAVSSISGSSDVMAALGLTVEQTPAEAEASLREDGYAYLHAPAFHPGMRHAGPVRMELGVRTAFNLIGPIANPARPRRQLMGVPDEIAAQKAAATLQALGSERAFVVTGDRIDELPLDDSGVILDVTPTASSASPVTAADHGLPTRLDRRAARRRRGRERRRSSRPSSTATSAGPGATSSCSTPAPRCSWPGRVADLREGVSGRPRPSTRAPPPRCSSDSGREPGSGSRGHGHGRGRRHGHGTS